MILLLALMVFLEILLFLFLLYKKTEDSTANSPSTPLALEGEKSEKTFTVTTTFESDEESPSE